MSQEAYRPIILLFGEGDFSFSRCLADLCTTKRYDVIATEYREKQNLLEYKNFINNERHLRLMPSDAKSDGPRFFVQFGVDLCRISWESIFAQHFPGELLRQPDVIQFNFPWHVNFKAENEDLLRSLFSFAAENLKPDGELRLAIVNTSSTYHWKYGFSEQLYKDEGFSLVGSDKFCPLYPGYRHVSSLPNQDLMYEIEKYGFEYRFKRACF